MKKILLFSLLLTIGTVGMYSQNRVNERATSLSYKSKEINVAKYWKQKDGKWESRSNKKFTYQSGVQDDNFSSIFIGKLDTLSILFIDYYKATWRYPHIKSDWAYHRDIHGALITDDDHNSLKNIKQGELVNIISYFNSHMYKRHPEYRFSHFLSCFSSFYSSSKTIYRINKRSYSEDFAERQYTKDNPPRYVFAAKRIVDHDEDVVRFCVFPTYLNFGEPAFIDSFYFEVPYQKYMLLFESDTKTKYK